MLHRRHPTFDRVVAKACLAITLTVIAVGSTGCRTPLTLIDSIPHTGPDPAPATDVEQPALPPLAS